MQGLCARRGRETGVAWRLRRLCSTERGLYRRIHIDAKGLVTTWSELRRLVQHRG